MTKYTTDPLEIQANLRAPKEIPYGYCHCGCGQKTRICAHTRTKTGDVKGQPHRFCKFHIWNRWPARFWEHVDILSEDECWIWQDCTNQCGYGSVGLNGKAHLAHRIAYELCVGPIPEGLCVLHTCDRPACVNAAHLFLGTQVDNILDCVAKGRQSAQLATV